MYKTFKEAFYFKLLNKKNRLTVSKSSGIFFKILLLIIALQINLPPVTANDSFETQEQVNAGQDAVCKLVAGPLGALFKNEHYNLIFHVLSKAISLYGNAPYIIFDLGPDGNPSQNWSICINIIPANHMPSTKPEFPYVETKIDGLQEISIICQKEPPVPAVCHELLANNLEKRSFFRLGTARTTEVKQSAARVDSGETVAAKPPIPETGVSPSNLIAAESASIQEAQTAVSVAPLEQATDLPATETPQPRVKTADEAENNRAWIMAQPSENYTLQVMVLSSKASVQQFLKKYAEYDDSLKYYPLSLNQQEKYVLIFGSFPSLAEAKKSKTNLPAEFKNSLEKRFKFIQNEIPLHPLCNSIPCVTD